MKIIIKLCGNGIHNYLDLIVENPKPEDLEIVTKIVDVVNSYNTEQIEKA